MIKRIFSFAGEYKRHVFLSPLFVVLETICELLLPLLMAKIIDEGIRNPDLHAGMGVVLRMGGWMVVLAGISLVLGIGAARSMSIASNGVGYNLRRAEFEQISKFSFGDIDRFSAGSLITRLTNDVTNIQNFVTICVRMLFRCLSQLVVALVVVFRLEWKLGIILVICMPVLAAAVGLIVSKCHRLFARMQKRIDELNEKVQETLVGIRAVKSFVRKDYELGKFGAANDALTRSGLAAVLRIILLDPIMMLGLACVTALVLYFGGEMVLGQQLKIGQLTSIITYISNILISIMMLAFALLHYVRASACAKRVFEVLDTEPEITDGTAKTLPPREGRVEFQNVSFRYTASGTGDDVLTGVSFATKPGQVVALVGGTGTGKSSLVNLIPRFYDVTGGRVLLDGMDVRDYPLEELRSRVGMVLQNNVLFSGTIRENLLWGDEHATEEQLIQAAKDAEAYDFIQSFPDGFDTQLEQGGVNVSGGQKQRLCIARAILRQPEILILDDSTSAVDSATEAKIRAAFRTHRKDTTVLLIAQRISSVRDADCILVLDEGTIVASGTHDELMASSAIYQEIYWSQQEGVGE